MLGNYVTQETTLTSMAVKQLGENGQRRARAWASVGCLKIYGTSKKKNGLKWGNFAVSKFLIFWGSCFDYNVITVALLGIPFRGNRVEAGIQLVARETHRWFNEPIESRPMDKNSEVEGCGKEWIQNKKLSI